MGRFERTAGLIAGLLSLGTAGSLLARDVTVPRRPTSPDTAAKSSSIFESIEAKVTPHEATSCPQHFIFVATVKTKVPVEVTYQWDRSDHAVGPVETVSWPAAGTHYVFTYWQIGSSTGRPVTTDQWERLHILAPEDVVSNAAPIRVRCPAQK